MDLTHSRRKKIGEKKINNRGFAEEK